MFVRILPMNLYQFVVSRAHDDFAKVTLLVKIYQELIEVDTLAHIFKNVSFEDDGFTLCHKPLKSLECPSLRSMIEMVVSSSTMPADSTSSASENRSCSPSHHSRACKQSLGDRNRSNSRSPNRQERDSYERYERYGDRNNNNRYRSCCGDRFNQSQSDRPIYHNYRDVRSHSYLPQRYYNNNRQYYDNDNGYTP